MKRVCSYAPGRTEIAGNHTDHQGGRVIAGAVSCGVSMTIADNGTDNAHVESAGFEPFNLNLTCDRVIESERSTTAALVRGVVAGLRERGVNVGGFDLQASSTVPAGGGLSSSAAFEVALGAGLDLLFGEATLGPVDLAIIGQTAERDYFGKPCGLMDQLACALGGVAAIDFADESSPAIERIDFDPERYGYTLCLIDTHCDHSLYNDEYAQVALDMHDVARFFGASGLSKVSEKDFFGAFERIRAQLSDRAALRGLHFYREMSLVDVRAQAMRVGDIDAFLEATRRSAASSAQYLQNVSCAGQPDQPAMVALALCDVLLGNSGACRIHGGGFGGTVQAFVPNGSVTAFSQAIDAHLGTGSCQSYRIDQKGARASWA